MTEADVSKLKEKLFAEARQRFPADQDRQNAYVFGVLRRLGWKPEREK